MFELKIHKQITLVLANFVFISSILVQGLVDLSY